MDDAPPPLSALGVAVLALLAERPMHPYEMYQVMLQRRDDRLVKVRPGSLYHAVDRLVRTGLAEAAGTDRDGNRPERTTYRVTEPGRRALQQRLTAMLTHEADEYPEFPLALSQAHNLPRADAARLLADRVASMCDSLASLDASAARVDGKVAERFWIDIDYQRAVLRAEIAWLEQLLERLTTGRIDW